MNVRLGIVSAWLLSGVLLAPPLSAWGADPDADLDRAAKVVNGAATTPAGQQQVAGRVAQELNESCKCSAFSAASLSAQHGQTGWGWGELLVENRLALAISQKTGLSFSKALAEVTSARQQGTGWGAIAKAHDLKVGPIVSDAQKSAKAVETAAKVGEKAQDKAAKAAAAEKGATGHASGGLAGGHGNAVGGAGGSHGGGSGGNESGGHGASGGGGSDGHGGGGESGGHGGGGGGGGHGK